MQQSSSVWIWPSIALPRRHLPWTAALAFVLPFFLYLLTLAPSIYNLDSAELTTAVATGGIVRATGYPLYLMLGRAWSELPLGDVAYRMNLFSAFSGALTLLLVERTLARWRVGPWARLGAVGLLASATFFWALALIAEVYTLHTLLMMALLLALLNWRAAPTPGRVGLVGLLVGLGLSHHLATGLLVPGVAWFLLATDRRALFQFRSLLAGAGALVLGLMPYLYLSYLYTQQPAFNYAGHYNVLGQFEPVDLTTLSGLWWLVSGSSFSGSMFAYDAAGLWGELVALALQLWRDFIAVGIGPVLLGAFLLWRRDWRLAGLLSLFFLGNGLFYADYRVIDKATMYLPNYVIWALWLGIGLEWLLDWVASDESGPSQRRLLGALIAVMVGVAVVVHWPLVNRSEDNSTRQTATDILSVAEEGALLFGWWDTIPAIEYLQLVEGERRDVRAINRFLLPYDAFEAMVQANLGTREIYVSGIPPLPLHPQRYEPVGEWYRIRASLPVPARPTDLSRAP